MECIWEEQKDGTVKCRCCHLPYHMPIHRRCRAFGSVDDSVPPDGYPHNSKAPESIDARKQQEAEVANAATRLGIEPKHIVNYARALWKWTRAGFPTRTDEEVERIYRELCLPCDEHVDGRCRRCGCRTVEKGMALTNKISMKTENCSEKKW